MIKIHFQVETPLYCGGFNAKKAELRAASIKGMLRYWYRAIQPELKKEREIFGSVDGQSLFRLHIDAYQKEINKNSRYFSRNISPGEKFTLNLQILPNKQYIRRDVFVSLWLMTTIGGLGARCRRGYGTLSIQQIDGWLPETAFFFRPVDSIEKWIEHVREGLKQCWQWYRTDQLKTTKYPMVHPMMRLFSRSKGNSTWQEALQIGKSVLKVFRQKYRWDTKVLQMTGSTDKGRYPSITWLRIVRIGAYYYPVYFVLPSDFSEKDYEQFAKLWGGFLIEKGFEESETK